MNNFMKDRRTVQRKNAASTLRFQTAFRGSEWKRFNKGCVTQCKQEKKNQGLKENPLRLNTSKRERKKEHQDKYLDQIPNIWSIVALFAKNRICILLVLVQNLKQK